MFETTAQQHSRMQVTAHRAWLRQEGRQPHDLLLTAPFTECPAVGADSSCGVLIVITNEGAEVKSDGSQGPYDSIEDTLTGVINESDKTVTSLIVSSDTDLFGFDGDGICSSAYLSCSYGPTGYEGPNVNFSGYQSDPTSGTINFANGGLQKGTSTYFSLEEALSASNIFAGGPSTPEQGGPTNGSEHITVCSSSNPVNCSTGDFWHTFTDFQIAGTGGGLTLTRTYDAANAAVDGPFGDGWTDSYNMSFTTDVTTGDLLIHQENGAVVSFSPDGSGGFTAPPRVLASLVANGSGYTFTRRSTGMQYNLGSGGELDSIVDRNGNTTTLSYDGGQLQTVTAPDGRALDFTWNADGHLASISDPLGRTYTYAYNSADTLATVTDPLGRQRHFTYDGDNQMLTMEDPNGGFLSNTYDGQGRVTQQVDPGGLVTTWSYTGDASSADGGTTTMTDPHGNQTVYDYIDLELVGVTHAAGTPESATTTYSYDPATLGITAMTDPDGHTTTSTYDARGNLTSTANALNQRTSYTYNTLDEVTSVTQPGGQTTDFFYDSHGNLTASTDPLGHATDYGYGDSSSPGSLTSAIDSDGHIVTLGYDSAGDVTSVTSNPSAGQSDVTVYGYNDDGEQNCVVTPVAQAAGSTCPSGSGTPDEGVGVTRHDADGEPITMIDVTGGTTSYTYDGDGNQTEVTDPNGHTTVTTFDGDDRPLTSTVGADGAQPSTTTDVYDIAAGSGACVGDASTTYCASTTDPNGHATVYFYDARGRLVREIRPGSHDTGATYDGVGNELTMTDNAGRVTSLGYDAANRLTSVSYSDGTTPSVTYRYDADGRRTSMIDGTGTTSYAYDAASRLTSEQDGTGNLVGYAYDNAGNLTSLTYPDGVTVQRGYDGANQLTSVTDWSEETTTFGYDANGDLATTTYPNGVVEASTFTPGSEMTGLTDTTGSQTLASYTYARDAATNVTGVTGAGTNPGPNESYGYDEKEQLTGYTSGATPSSYSYDPDGNLVTLPDGTALSYNSADELTTSTDASNAVTTYGHNQVGDLTAITPPSGSASSFGYDQSNRLTTFARGSNSASYTYNGDGLRVAKAVGSSHSAYVWDMVSGQVPLLLSDGTTEYAYGPGGLPIEQVQPGGGPQVSLVASGSAADLLFGLGSLKVTFSAAAQAGDQILVAVNMHNSETVTAPTGYTELGTYAGSGSGERTVVFRKTAVGGETSVTVTFGGLSLLPKTAVALVYRGIEQAHPVDGSTDTVTLLGATSVTTNSLDAVVNRDELVLFEDSLNNLPGATWTPPAGMSTRATASALLVNSAVADQTVGGRGVTGTRTATMSSIGQLAGVAILLRRDDGTQYLLHDQQGSTRLITDRLGHVVGGYTYTPYGATISHTGAATSSLRYDGQYQDDETGLYYLQARYYDPTLGQFLTVDPLVNTTRQPYAYALGSPLMGGDPTGLGCGITSFSSIGDCLSDVASAVSGAFEATASGLEQIASGVGQIVGDAATWVKNNPWEAVGIVAGVLAAATGIGAIVDAEIGVGALTLSGAQLGGVSALLGTGAAGLDLNKCLGDHDVAACTGAALGGVSALATLPELFAIAGGAEDDGILLGALHGLAAAGGAFGISSLLVDIIDAFSDGPLC